jgi:glutathione peroxidase
VRWKCRNVKNTGYGCEYLRASDRHIFIKSVREIANAARLCACAQGKAVVTSIGDFSATDIDGRERSLADFAGQVVLVVNVASKCGFTSQYEGLERLWRAYAERGFVVLGFPCNQFGHQEPGDESQIKAFCSANYDVTFPMFAKVDVNGDDAHPLFAWLKGERPGIFGTGAIKWNFTKFLIDRHGQVVKRYASKDSPASLAADLEALLGDPR